jgi:acyl dehydratase
MNYAAGLGEVDPVFYDTVTPGHPLSHPMFSVAAEWSVGGLSGQPGMWGLTLEEGRRGVHAAHELHLHRPLVPPVKARLEQQVAVIRSRRSGAEYVLRTVASDDAGPLWTSWNTSVFRDVAVDGEDRDGGLLPPPVERLPREWRGTTDIEVPIAANAAHVYDSCSGIFNPIHTDVAFARAAGLPDPILQGTATLALAVSAGVQAFAGGQPQRVRQIHGRFRAMVLLPNVLTVSADPPDQAGRVRFRVFTDRQECAVDDGLLVLADGA